MIKLTSKQVLLKLLAEEGYEGLYVLLSRPCRWIMRRKSLENTSLLKVCCFIRIFLFGQMAHLLRAELTFNGIC